MKLSEFVPTAGVVLNLRATDVAGALSELSQTLASLSGLDPNQVRDGLLEREQLGSTALGHGVAAPHAKLNVPQTIGVLGISGSGISFDTPDEQPVRIVVAFLSPVQGGRHLKALAAIGQELGDDRHRSRLLAAKNPEEAYRVLSTPGAPESNAREQGAK